MIFSKLPTFHPLLVFAHSFLSTPFNFWHLLKSKDWNWMGGGGEWTKKKWCEILIFILNGNFLLIQLAKFSTTHRCWKIVCCVRSSFFSRTFKTKVIDNLMTWICQHFRVEILFPPFRVRQFKSWWRTHKLYKIYNFQFKNLKQSRLLFTRLFRFSYNYFCSRKQWRKLLFLFSKSF